MEPAVTFAFRTFHLTHLDIVPARFVFRVQLFFHLFLVFQRVFRAHLSLLQLADSLLGFFFWITHYKTRRERISFASSHICFISDEKFTKTPTGNPPSVWKPPLWSPSASFSGFVQGYPLSCLFALLVTFLVTAPDLRFISFSKYSLITRGPLGAVKADFKTLGGFSESSAHGSIIWRAVNRRSVETHFQVLRPSRQATPEPKSQTTSLERQFCCDVSNSRHKRQKINP